MPVRLPALTYDDSFVVRRVRTRGDIKWAGGRVFISEVFRGESLGLKKTQNGDLEVFFGTIRIGTINPQAMTFTAAVQI